jgi:hypothetical protein
MRNKNFNFILLFVIFVLFSCQKEYSKENTGVILANPNWNVVNPSSSIHPARITLDAFTPASVSNIFDNALGNFQNLGDIVINFPTNCFVKLDNSSVIGNITITLKKATKFDEMIYYGLGTLTNNALLSTAGMINIEAKQGADVLKVAPGKKIDLYFNRPTPQPYLGFIGNTTSDIANATTWNLNTQWQADTASLGQTGTSYTRIKVDSCTWVNCDYFYNQPNPTNIFVKLPADYGNLNTVCYIIFRSDKVISGLYADGVNQRFWQGGSYKVPSGKNVRIVAISKRNNKNYYASQDVTIGSDMIVTIPSFDEVTDLELKNRLNAL